MPDFYTFTGLTVPTTFTNCVLAITTFMISPWDVTSLQGASLGGSGALFNPGALPVPTFNTTIGPIPAINEAGVLDIRLSLSPWFSLLNPVSTATDDGEGKLSLHVGATHIWGYLDSTDPNVHYNVAYENQHLCDLPSNFFLNGQNSGSNFTKFPQVAEFSPKLASQGMSVQGKYIGTLIELYVRIDGIGNLLALGWPNFNLNLGSPRLQVRARNLYKPGELGPARVIRWDGLDADQQLRINGVSNVQCVPQGDLAPFTQSAAMYSAESVNVNVLPFVHELFDGPTPIRRNWTDTAYTDFVNAVVPTMSPEVIMDWIKDAPKLSSSAQAAGLFSGIGGALGGLAGNLLGQPGLGAQLGQLAGGIGDQIAGTAAGQFGGGEARGQFGGGQFGGGQFGMGGQAAGDYNGFTMGQRIRGRPGL
jgi:hypothetical protein